MLKDKDKARKEFAEDFVGAFAKIGEIAASFNDPGEWVSATINITSDPQGEAPVIAMIIYPGTTRKHAEKIQKDVAGSFLDQ